MIRGRRVALRPVEESDLPLIQRWQNHPEVWWYMDYDRTFSYEDIAEDIERAGFEIDKLATYYFKGEPKPMGYTYEGRALSR